MVTMSHLIHVLGGGVVRVFRCGAYNTVRHLSLSHDVVRSTKTVEHCFFLSTKESIRSLFLTVSFYFYDIKYNFEFCFMTLVI